MAAPGSAVYFTDDELRKLGGKLTDEEISSLSDDEVRRWREVTNVIEKPEAYRPLRDPLQGKPTIQQYERRKKLAETPRVVAPTRLKGFRDTPEVPQEGPSNLKDFLNSIGEAATTAGDRSASGVEPLARLLAPLAAGAINPALGIGVGAIADAFEPPDAVPLGDRPIDPNPFQDAIVRNPVTEGEKIRAQQDRLIGAHQGLNFAAGDRQTDPEMNAAIGQMLPTVLTEAVGSLSETVLNPLGQLMHKPGEFALNVLPEAFLLYKMTKGVKPLVRAVDDIADATPRDGGASGSPFMERRSWDEQRQMVADEVAGWKTKGQSADEVYGRIASMKSANEITGAQESAFLREAQKVFAPSVKADPDSVFAFRGAAEFADESSAARASIARATPEEINAANESLESTLDQIDALKDANRQLGGDPEITAQLRALEEQVGGTQQVIAEHVSVSPFRASDLVRSKDGTLYVVESVESSTGKKAIANVVDLEGNKSRFAVDALDDASDAITDTVPRSGESGSVDDAVAQILAGTLVGGTAGALVDEESPIEGGIMGALTGGIGVAAVRGARAVSKGMARDLAEMDRNLKISFARTKAAREAGVELRGAVETVDAAIPVATYKGRQAGFRDRPGFNLYNLERDIPGHRAGSTVSEKTLRNLGYDPPPAPNEVSTATEVAQGAFKLTDVLSMAPMGGILLAGIEQDDKIDPTPKQGSPLAFKNALWAIPAGIFAYGIGRYMASPAFRRAVHTFTRIDKSGPADLERVFEEAIAPMLPDTPLTPFAEMMPSYGMRAGAAAGAFVGSDVGQDELDPGGAIFGLLMGGVMGSKVGTNLAKQFKTGLSARQLYRRYFTEAAGMSASAFAAKQEARIRFEGRVREIKDLTDELDSFDEATKGKIQAVMSGNMNSAALEPEARAAAYKARKMFDDLTMDLLASGLVKDDVLRDTLQTNMGRYVPRLYLRYELDDPREVVDAWLRSQGKGWGYISSKNYIKHKKDLPPEVLKSLGEITDNPGYLLARRGTITAADIEQARYHKFLLSSPENAIPAKVVIQERRAMAAQRVAAGPLSGQTLESTDFKSWFGGSQIIDDTAGTPLKVYHQTAVDNVASIESQGFSIDPKLAHGRLADSAIPNGIFFKPGVEDIGVGGRGFEKAPVTQIPAYLSIKNPLRVADREELAAWARKSSREYDELAASPFDRTGLRLDEAKRAGDMRASIDKALADQGFDGVILERDLGADDRVTKTYIALHPKQIKIDKKLPGRQSAIAGVGQVDQPQQIRFYSADGGMQAAEWQGRSYWKMPDNPHYGLVRSQYVEASVASDIMSTHEASSGLAKLFDAPLASFKFFKAVMNPASQFRNMASNAILADVVGGVAPWRMDLWAKSGKELLSKGRWYERARSAGVFGGEFTTSEIQNLLDPALNNAKSMFAFMGETIPKYADKPAEFFMKWHQTSEAHARLTVFMNSVQKLGMTETQAAKFARRVIPDYQDVPRWIKVVRKSPFGSPFVSFSYKALPRSLEAAVAFGDPKKMMRFWKYPLAMGALNEYSAQKHGLLGKDEETDIFGSLRRTALRTMSIGTYNPDSYDTFRKYLPGHVGSMQLALPYRDQYDRPNYLDATFLLPWGDAGEMGKGEFGKHIAGPMFPRQLEPSNPWFQTAAAAMTGKDSFTGRDIIPPGAVGMEHMAALGTFMMRAWGPSVLNPAGYGAQNLEKSFSGRYADDPNVRSPGMAVASELGGARARPVDPMTAFKFKRIERDKDLDANKAEIRRYARGMLAEGEDLTQAKIEELKRTNPSKPLMRALRRRERIYREFNEKYPADELPPSPEKLVKAIKRQYAE